MVSIKKKIKNTCEDFVANIQLFRVPIKSETALSKILLTIHSIFAKLMNQIDIYNRHIHVKTIKLYRKRESGELVWYGYSHRDTTFTVLVHNNYGVLQIETGLVALNCKAMDYINRLNKRNQLEQVELFLSLYADVRWRNCDFCLEYNILPSFSFPIGRALEMDYVAAFHLECNEKSDEKHRII